MEKGVFVDLSVQAFADASATISSPRFSRENKSYLSLLSPDGLLKW